MNFSIYFMPRADKDMEKLNAPERDKIFEKILALRQDLFGDVKKLTNMNPRYRLRVGNYRVLFNVEANKVIVERIMHRSNAYK